MVLPAQIPPVPTVGLPPRDVVLKENIDPVTLSPVEVRLNARAYTDPVEDFVTAGTTETWNFINLTVDAHPMHTHLVQFRVVSRQAISVPLYTADWYNWLAAGRNPAVEPLLANYLMGRPILPTGEEAGWKDTVKAYPGMVTTVVATFTVPSTATIRVIDGHNSYGKWVYHCHILEHEENDMMRPFEVVP
jgi:spore coat protein A